MTERRLLPGMEVNEKGQLVRRDYFIYGVFSEGFKLSTFWVRGQEEGYGRA